MVNESWLKYNMIIDEMSSRVEGNEGMFVCGFKYNYSTWHRSLHVLCAISFCLIYTRDFYLTYICTHEVFLSRSMYTARLVWPFAHGWLLWQDNVFMIHYLLPITKKSILQDFSEIMKYVFQYLKSLCLDICM